MELEIKYDDGPGNRLAYAAVSFYQTGKPAKMSLTVDTADFTDADALGTGANATVLESTLAHELMHSVMQWNLRFRPFWTRSQATIRCRETAVSY